MYIAVPRYLEKKKIEKRTPLRLAGIRGIRRLRFRFYTIDEQYAKQFRSGWQEEGTVLCIHVEGRDSKNGDD